MRGFRIEPGEIEVVLIDETGAPTAVAVGWPITPNGAGGIVAFVETDALDVASLDERVKLRLPPYMVPREYRSLAKFPRNANGKVDRKALIATLENKA